MSEPLGLTAPIPKENGFRPEPDLVDRIAAALPAEVRADYYREMRHCRLLPENDEMLRILKIMQFLTLLIEQAPSQVAAEREQLGRMLAEGLAAAERTQQTNLAYYRGLEERIAKLPKAIEQGISPEAIAARITEAVRQQFAQSGLPETAKAFDLLASEVKQSTKDFQQTAAALTGTYNSVAAKAGREMDTMVRSVQNVTYYAQNAQETLAQKFLEIQPRLAAAAGAVVLAVGMLLGGFLGWLLHPSAVAEACPAPMAAPASLMPPEQPAAPEKPVPKVARRRPARPQLDQQYTQSQ